MKCGKCSQILPDNSLFCPFCGTDLSAVPEAQASEAPVLTQPARQPDKPAIIIDKKVLIIAGIAAAVLLLLGIGIGLLAGQKGETEPVCPACGEEVSVENKFCRHCGESLAPAD